MISGSMLKQFKQFRTTEQTLQIGLFDFQNFVRYKPLILNYIKSEEVICHCSRIETTRHHIPSSQIMRSYISISILYCFLLSVVVYNVFHLFCTYKLFWVLYLIPQPVMGFDIRILTETFCGIKYTCICVQRLLIYLLLMNLIALSY